MSPLDWALRAFKQYAVFGGRARRREFWWFAAFHFFAVIVLTIVAGIVGLAFGEARVLASVGYVCAFIVGFVPSYAVMVRRLHDIGRSGWSCLIAFVPIIGTIVLLFWFCMDSTDDNRWGPNPKVSEVTPHGPTLGYDG